MKIIVIIGDCLQENSSANLCHLAYIRGLVDAGHEITLVSADLKGREADPLMRIPDGVKSFRYNGLSLYERVSILLIGKNRNAQAGGHGEQKPNRKRSFKSRLLGLLKKAVHKCYGPHGIYATIARTACKFSSPERFQFMLSISTPPSSHLLASRLLRSGHVTADHWIQIWEDPWYADVYGFNVKDEIFREEQRLLGFAERICYVSPITLENQKKLFPAYAEKMFWYPLPAYYSEKAGETNSELFPRFGYFGNYYPSARNLLPFYEAAKQSGVSVKICGDSSLRLESTDRIDVRKRVELTELKTIEAQTDILVFLCNRKGGQIPGKIYQYAATNKPILFLLDGTEEEKSIIRTYFEPYQRFVFCENTVEEICKSIERIRIRDYGEANNRPLTDFEPVKIIQKILNEGMK